MQALDFVSGLYNRLEFSQPLSCLYQAMSANTENVFYCLNTSAKRGHFTRAKQEFCIMTDYKQQKTPKAQTHPKR